jgi:hypothetical protein
LQTDFFSTLEKEYGYKDSHFDFIQQYLRRICLQCQPFETSWSNLFQTEQPSSMRLQKKTRIAMHCFKYVLHFHKFDPCSTFGTPYTALSWKSSLNYRKKTCSSYLLAQVESCAACFNDLKIQK